MHFVMSPWWACADYNWQVANVSVPFHVKDLRSREKEGDGFSEELGVVVGVHQGSVMHRLLLIIVLEGPSGELHTGCSVEMLYADVLLIIINANCW